MSAKQTDIETERAYLCSLIFNSDIVLGSTADMLLPSDFQGLKHSELFSLCRELSVEGPLDVALVRAEAQSQGICDYSDPLWSAIFEVQCHAVNAPRFAAILRTCSRNRRIRSAIKEHEYKNTSETEAALRDALSELPGDGSKPQTLLISELLDLPEILKPAPRIPTGIPSLDEALGGGFIEGSTVVISARQGDGKSTLASNLVRSASTCGIESLLLSLEDAPDATGRKLLSQVARVPVRALENYQHPQALSKVERDRVEASRVILKKIPLSFDFTTNDLDEVIEKINAEANNGKKLITLDQTSWVHVHGSTDPFFEAAEISRRLKLTAKQLRIVIVILVQINREGGRESAEKKRLKTYHLKDSSRFEQDASVVLIIQNPEVVGYGPDTMTLDMVKNRDGRAKQDIVLKYGTSYFTNHA